MPYRVDLEGACEAALDRLVELGALDVEIASAGSLAALMPDSVPAHQIAFALGVGADRVVVSPALGRDADSIWVLSPRAIRVGRLRIVPAQSAEPGALRLIDAAAFGTGLHPTTALCLEALEQIVERETPCALLDVGTGSGVLALSALLMGVPRALAIDTDEMALSTAAENARLNGLGEHLQLAQGGPERVAGTWPLVCANILAAPLIDMAPSLVRRVGHRGQLVLSGIPRSVERDVTGAYCRLGMQQVGTTARAGWSALVLASTW